MKALWNKLFVPALVIAFGVSAVNAYADNHSTSGSTGASHEAKSQPSSAAKTNPGKTSSSASSANHTGSTSSKPSNKTGKMDTGSASSKTGSKTDPKADPMKGHTTSGNSSTSKKSDSPWGGSKSDSTWGGYGGNGSTADSTGKSTNGDAKKTTPSTGSKGSSTTGKKEMPKKDTSKGGTTTQKDKPGSKTDKTGTSTSKKDSPKKDSSKGGTTTQKDKPGNKTDKTGTSTSKKDSPWGDQKGTPTKTSDHSKMDPCPKDMPKHKTGDCWTKEQCKPNWNSCASYNKWNSCPEQWHVKFRDSYCLPTNYCYWGKRYFDARCGCYTYYDSYSCGWYYYEPVVKCYIPVNYCEQYAVERTESLEECDVCEVEVPVCETVRNYCVLPVKPTCQPYNYGCKVR